MRVRLMIVDDEVPQLNLIGKVILKYRPEYEITMVDQAEQALQFLENDTYDAVLTDIRMPDMDGIELIRRMRSLQSESIEIMILSGFDDFQYAKNAITYNVLEYLLKPIDGERLEYALKKLETKLEANRSAQHIQDSYRTMEKQRITTALFKLASNLELNVQEEVCINQLKDKKLRLIFLENCDPKVFCDTFLEGIYVEIFSEHRFLLFQILTDEILEKTVFPPPDGHMIIGIPCGINDLALQWKQIEDYADTCRRMNVKIIEQKPYNEQTLQMLKEKIVTQRLDSIRLMAVPLDRCLRNGELTFSKIYCTLRTVLVEMWNAGVTFGFYQNRREDFFQILDERFAKCKSGVQICDTINDFLDKSDEESFSHNVEIYLKAHYTEECSLEYISRVFGYSTSHFSRLFTATFGIPYTRYLSEYRLERASEFLKFMDIPIGEIAIKVGIPDSEYFARQFNKKYRLSPTKYRKKFRERI